MNTLEKAIVVSAIVAGLGLALTNPNGTKAAGGAGSSLIGAWFKGLWGKS